MSHDLRVDIAQKQGVIDKQAATIADLTHELQKLEALFRRCRCPAAKGVKIADREISPEIYPIVQQLRNLKQSQAWLDEERAKVAAEKKRLAVRAKASDPIVLMVKLRQQRIELRRRWR